MNLSALEVIIIINKPFYPCSVGFKNNLLVIKGDQKRRNEISGKLLVCIFSYKKADRTGGRQTKKT